MSYYGDATTGYHENGSDIVQRQCSWCFGSGRSISIGNKPCPDCAGTGGSYTPGVGANIFSTCKTCNGTKIVQGTFEDTCGKCGGSGIITETRF